MKHCELCNVNVRGNETVCPLCKNKLSGTRQEETYPKIPTMYNQFKFRFGFLILLTIMGCVSCVAINMILVQNGFWSIFVLLGALSFWITLAYAVQKRDYIAKDITIWFFIVSLFSVVWDWSTGWHGWSLNFVFPIACSMAMVSLTILAKLMKLQGEDYIIYLIINILFGAIPIILYAAGLASLVLPSAICVALSVVSITVLILFERKNILDEFKKNFHL